LSRPTPDRLRLPIGSTPGQPHERARFADASISGTVIDIHDTELIDMSASYGASDLRTVSTESAI